MRSKLKLETRPEAAAEHVEATAEQPPAEDDAAVLETPGSPSQLAEPPPTRKNALIDHGSPT